MKLLAVFGLALAVVAMDKSASGDQKQPIHGPQSHLERFKDDPNNPVYCSEVLLMVYNNTISLAAHPEVVFPLLRHCLETGRLFLPENFLEMDIAHVAAFIFMFRIQGKEGAAECLYNAAMEKHFFVKFAAKLHEESYPLNPLQVFKSLRTLDSFEDATCEIPLLSGLEEKHKRRLFMLWTVRMYGKGLEGKDAYQRLLKDADQVMLILASMGIPLEVLGAGLIALQKELPVGTTPSSLPSLLLMLLSLNRDWYSGLENSEKTQLRAFLERYLILKLRGLDLLAKTLTVKGLKQLEEAFKSEDEFRYKYLDSGTIGGFTEYFRKVMLAGCPAFLLKRMLDFYLENSSFKTEAVLDGKHYFLEALTRAFEEIKKGVYSGIVEKGVCSDKWLVCFQMKNTISKCDEGISKLRLAFAKENPAANKEWEETSPARRNWIQFKETLGGEICFFTSFKLSN